MTGCDGMLEQSENLFEVEGIGARGEGGQLESGSAEVR